MSDSQTLQILLDTNDPPTEAQAEEVRQICTTLVQQSAGLGEEIATLQADLAEAAALEARVAILKDRKREIDEKIICYTAVISPIRRLPHDILCEIFLASEDYSPDIISPRAAPAVLSSVCKAWHETAVTTAILWSAFSVRPAWDNIRKYERALLVWLDRSRSVPLKVIVGPKKLNYGHDIEVDLRDILKHLIFHAERWQSIELCLRPDHLRPFLSFPGLQTLSLKEFKIHSVEIPELSATSESTVWSDTLCFLHHSPMLHKVSFEGSSYESFPSFPLPSIPWNQLTSLTLRASEHNFFLGLDALLEILAQCCNLKELSLRLSAFSDIVQPSSNTKPQLPITLPFLKSFDIYFSYSQGEFITEFLPSLVLPNLRQLQVGLPFVEGVPAIAQLVDQSVCPLNRLVLQGVLLKKEAFVELLRPVSRTLEELEILEFDSNNFLYEKNLYWDMEFGVVDDFVLQSLIFTADKGEGNLCSALRKITLEYGDQVSRDTIISILSSRTYKIPEGVNVSKLEFVAVLPYELVDGPIFMEDDVDLKPIVAAGVELVL